MPAQNLHARETHAHFDSPRISQRQQPVRQPVPFGNSALHRRAKQAQQLLEGFVRLFEVEDELLFEQHER